MAEGLEDPSTPAAATVVSDPGINDATKPQRPHLAGDRGMIADKARFGGDGSWVAVGKDHMKLLSKVPEFDLVTRLHFAALSRMNRLGHAPFNRGELTRICSSVNKQTGELRPARSDSVNKAIRKAVARGLLEPESGNRCLVVPYHLAQMNSGPVFDCLPHGRPGPSDQGPSRRLAA